MLPSLRPMLLCDEISLGLAPIVVKDIFACLPTIVAEGTAVVIVEQDVHQAVVASSHVYCIREGRISLEGPSHTMTQEAIKSAYFGV